MLPLPGECLGGRVADASLPGAGDTGEITGRPGVLEIEAAGDAVDALLRRDFEGVTDVLEFEIGTEREVIHQLV